MKKAIEKVDIMVSKEEFAQYVEVQKGGMFNMFDPQARQMTSLDRKQWVHIITNYEYLQELYKTEK